MAPFLHHSYQLEREDEIKEYVAGMERVWGRTLECGYNDAAKCMMLTFDPVISPDRPLVWYLVSFVFFL
jgi:hypothetical protein